MFKNVLKTFTLGIAAIIGLILLAFGVVAYNYFHSFAEDEAKPIDKALSSTGAVKKGSYGTLGVCSM